MFEIYSEKIMLNNIKKIFCLFVLSGLAPVLLAFAQNTPKSYSEAYNLCTPVAHGIARNKCGYGQLFEGYYTQCMHQSGYGDDTNTDPAYYEGYLKAYKTCSSTADNNAKLYCNYTGLYEEQYHKCMAEYGFDAYGNRVSSGGKKFEFDF